jgi:hypothetical protein
MNPKYKRESALVSAMIALTLSGAHALAQVPEPPLSRTPNPLPNPSSYTYTVSPDGKTTTVETPQGPFPASDPWVNPTNLLPTLYQNVKAANGTEIPNTLSSSPQHPYNLHPDPIVTPIDKTSPTDDLAAIFKAWRKTDKGNGPHHHENEGHGDGPHHHDNEGHGDDYVSQVNAADLQRAIDILEGNPVPNRVYSGIPMIHYNGPNKVKKVTPIKDANGNVVGGTVDVHQIWFDTHIESDTAFVDPSEVLNVPFTVNYIVDTLNRGHEDFAPMQMYVDPTMGPPAMPLVTMDLTFFPMEEGTRTAYQLAMAPGKFFNLTYHWGWRRHPPRVEVHENALKVAMGKTLVDWEVDTFGPNPRADQASKEAAIAMISDLAPSKRMWTALRALKKNGPNPALMAEVERAFLQWQDRNTLPDGVTEDPDADMTLFYADNTIYGHQKGYINESQPVLDKWKLRGAEVKVKLINGDYFPHAYISVDFGGFRGWENTFHNTIPVGGDGPWFTFGRAYWEMNTPTPILVPAATAPTAPPQKPEKPMDMAKIMAHRELWQKELDPEWKRAPHNLPRASRPSHNNVVLGEHNVVLKLNYEPSLRLRLYQFDPLHHEQAIWSVH